MNVKGIGIILCLVLLLFGSPVNAYTEIRAPNGVIEAPNPQWFTVDAGGFAGASQIQVLLKWDPQFIVIEDIAVNSSLSSLTIVETGRNPSEKTLVCNGAGMALVTVNASSFTQEEILPLLSVYIRPTDLSGSTNVNVSGYVITNAQPGEPQLFTTTVNGTITAHGGNTSAAMGAVVFPSGSIERGSTAVFPLRLGNLDGVNVSLYLSLDPPSIPPPQEWIPAVTLANVTLNHTITGVDLKKLGNEPFIYGAEISSAAGITQGPINDYLDVTFSAAPDGSADHVVFIANHSNLYRYMPSNGFRANYPYASATNGAITITGGSQLPGTGKPAIIAPTGTVLQGTHLTLPVSIANLTGAGGIGFSLSFNPEIVKIDHVTANSTFSDILVTSNINNQTGELRVAVTNGSSPMTAGSLPLPIVDVRFNAINAGNSDLVFFTYTEWTQAGEVSDFAIQAPGQVTVLSLPPPPVIAFIANTTSGDAPLTVEFSDISTGSPIVWNWSFGDGFFSNVTNPVHMYMSAGNYSVCLTAANLYGSNSTSKPDYITVTPQKPDLIPVVISAPRYVKKWNDGSLHINASFRVVNTGMAAAVDPFTMKAEFVDKTAEFTEDTDIAPGGNMTYNFIVNILPGYSGSTVINRNQNIVNDWLVNYTVHAGGNVGLGNYLINLTADAFHDIEETNETNNRVSRNATVTYPDLIAFVKTESVHGLPNSNTSITGVSFPGTYRISYGVINTGKVFAIPTGFNFSVNGVNQTSMVPALGPNERWDGTPLLQTIDQYTGGYNFSVFANSDRREIETTFNNNANNTNLSPIRPVTIAMPRVTGATDRDTLVSLVLTNISGSAPVTSLSVPVQFDSTVCYIADSSAMPGITITQSLGRATFTGSGLNIAGPTADIGNVTLRARDDAGRSSALTSLRNAYVMSTDGQYLELGITSGVFEQESRTDARVEIYTPPRGPVGENQTLSVTVYNTRATPVSVNANVTIAHETNGNQEIWSMSEILLASYESKPFMIRSWRPMAGGVYVVNATISGDGITDNNKESRRITIEDYQLEITPQNKQYWDAWYGYNTTVFQNNYFWLGTFYTANQGEIVNGSVRIWYYDNWTPVDIESVNVVEFWTSYPSFQQWYGYNSEWNYMGWYWINAKQLGKYRYSITLEARGKTASVNGTIEVREPYVDIKVVNSAMLTTENSKDLPFPIYNRTPSEQQYAVLNLAAGAEGRTLQGLQYLIGYPHGCPEQTNSPALAALRVKQYYETRGALNNELNDTLRQTMQAAISQMQAPDGYNAQQLDEYKGSYGDGSGGWAWGKGSTPSMFYTLYPMYVFSELLQDNDPEFWQVSYSNHQIDLNASTNWLLKLQQGDGRWTGSGYIYNDVEWTGFILMTMANDQMYNGLNVTMKEQVNASMQKALGYLSSHDYSGENAQALAHGIFGLKAIKDRGIGNISLINDNITRIGLRLYQANVTAPGGTKYWQDSWYVEPTANAIIALNESGYTPLDETLLAGTKYLVGKYYGGGGWGSTRSSAAAINALVKVQPVSVPDFNVNVEIRNPAGITVYGPVPATFDATHFTFQHELTRDELGLLYGSGSGAGTVVISGKSDVGTDASRLVVAIDSRERVPRSIAFATIDREYIDPMATDFSLDVTIPNPGLDLKEGDERDIGFTVNNNLAGSTNQTVMILEIPTGSDVNFTGSVNAANKAYWKDAGEVKHYISHMFNATQGKLYVYPGSDDESQPSVINGMAKTFYVPLRFLSSGNLTVEARVYPMYNDTWMAIGSDNTFVKGFGNITLNAVDPDNRPIMTANFYIDGSSVESGKNTTSQRKLEGSYAIAIQNGTSWVNATVTVSPGDTSTYTAQFALDTTIPHIATVVGAPDEVSVMRPTIEDTVNASSANHWNATQSALKGFNSSISSSGGYATIEIDIPMFNRNIGTMYLNDTISVGVYNATGGPFGYTDFTIQGNILRINNINTADITGISIRFKGRLSGDVNSDGVVNIFDARDIAWYRAGLLAFNHNQQFYADVGDDGTVNIFDARDIAWYRAGLLDTNYQSV